MLVSIGKVLNMYSDNILGITFNKNSKFKRVLYIELYIYSELKFTIYKIIQL